MQITRRPDVEAIFFDAMKQFFDRDIREGIHVSDLLTPRLAYYQRTQPQSPTEDQVLYWLAGRAHEEFFGLLHGFQRGAEREIDGIRLRPDFHTSIPIEFKTRRRGWAKDGEEATQYRTYLDQLGSYCALLNAEAGWLAIFNLTQSQHDGTTRPEFRVYETTWEKEEQDTLRQRLQHGKNRLEHALAVQNPAALPLCWDFLCGRQSREIIKKPFCLTCKREFEGEWGITRHLEARTGKGHEATPAEYHRLYQIKCQWYGSCEPWRNDPARGISGQIGENAAASMGSTTVQE